MGCRILHGTASVTWNPAPEIPLYAKFQRIYRNSTSCRGPQISYTRIFLEYEKERHSIFCATPTLRFPFETPIYKQVNTIHNEGQPLLLNSRPFIEQDETTGQQNILSFWKMQFLLKTSS